MFLVPMPFDLYPKNQLSPATTLANQIGLTDGKWDRRVPGMVPLPLFFKRNKSLIYNLAVKYVIGKSIAPWLKK